MAAGGMFCIETVCDCCLLGRTVARWHVECVVSRNHVKSAHVSLQLGCGCSWVVRVKNNQPVFYWLQAQQLLLQLFYGPLSWTPKRNMPFSSGFMEQGKITNTDTPTVRLGATPSRQISDPPPSSPHFYAGCPSCHNPASLSWDRHNICWLAYPVAWLQSQQVHEYSISDISQICAVCHWTVR